jgi:ornithine cyclodeaminase/alanine dehydrogenase-like protein (mu-crystallin family)
MKLGRQILYLSDGDVRKCIGPKDSVKLVEGSIRDLGLGHAVEEKFYLSVKHEGFVKTMSCYYERMDVHMTKVFSLFTGNAMHGLQTVNTLITLVDGKTGVPIAVMNSDWITALKTSGATAAAAHHLAKPNSSVIGIVGAGVQGRSHLLSLAQIFNIKEARIADERPKARERYVSEMSGLCDFDILAVNSIEEAIRGVDICVAVTTADEPLIKAEWIEPGLFIAKAGSFQELDPAVITAVDKVVVDSWKYTVRYRRVKELTELAEAGTITAETIYAELPDILAGKKKGRTTEQESVLFVSIGFGVDNAALAGYVYRKAVRRGIGEKLPLIGSTSSS